MFLCDYHRFDGVALKYIGGLEGERSVVLEVSGTFACNYSLWWLVAVRIVLVTWSSRYLNNVYDMKNFRACAGCRHR